MPLNTPEVAIGSLTTWHPLQVVTDGQRPQLDSNGTHRPLLPGAVSYRYWTVTVGMPGGLTETVTGRLLVHNGAASPPAGAVMIVPGSHRTYIRVPDAPENDPVEAGRLEAKP